MTSLLEFILNLLRDPAAQAQFNANPQQALRDHGFDEVCGQDVHDALPLVVDNVLVSGAGGALPSPQPGEDHFDIAIRQIDHIVNNYSYTDSHDTNVDYSVHQTIWTQGDVNQSFDNDYGSDNGNTNDNDTVTANDSTVVDGDGNDTVTANDSTVVVGDDNATVGGDADVQNFGQGDVTGNSGNSGDNSECDSHEVTHQHSHTTIDASYHEEHEHNVDIDHTDQHGLVNVAVDDTLNNVDLLSHNDVDLLNGLHL